MWQRVAIVAGLGFIAGFVVAMLVAGATILKSKVADTNQTRTLQLPTSATTEPTTTTPSTETTPTPATTPKSTTTAPDTANLKLDPYPPILESDLKCGLSDSEKQKIEYWIINNSLNKYGDPSNTVYTGGTPLFNEFTGKYIERCQYIIDNHPTKPWNG